MAWITLTEMDLASTLAGPEIEKIKLAALKIDQPNCVLEALSEAVDEVRGYIAACSRHAMGPEGTLPERLKAAALDIAAHRVLTRVMLLPNEARKLRWEEANRKLRDVAAGKMLVEDPMTPAAAAEQGTSFPPPVVTKRVDE